MIPIGVTQRVECEPHRNERRDCLDQAWTHLMADAGLLALPIPNHPETALGICGVAKIAGFVLTGGDDLAAYGGDTAERDATEFTLLDFAAEQGLPVLGVCRGMQVIQHRFGARLYPVAGHVTPQHGILVEGKPAEVNSYHRWGTCDTPPGLKVWAVAEDGVVEAIRHVDGFLVGIMWHPERTRPFAATDIALFRRMFASAGLCVR